MKPFYLLTLTLFLALTLLTGCGGQEAPPAEAQAQSAETASAAEPTAEPTPEPTAEPTPEPTAEPEPSPTPEAVHPYAWLGLSNMPSCRYLDLLASQHYWMEIDSYAGGYVAKRTEAQDGLTAYIRNDNLSLNLEGMIYTFNDRQMICLCVDMTELYPSSLAERAAHVEQGINEFGRVFQGSGSESVPLYAEASGDTAEYEYYEYLTDNSSPDAANTLTERFYLKDGDVFAVYKLAVSGDAQVELTDVIQGITDEIPEGTFQLPANMDEYTLYE